MPPYPWQSRVWETFVGSSQNEKLPHAILLTSQEGLGVDKLALAMAQYVLCGSPEGNSACGDCKSCQLLKGASHPDLLLIESQTDSGQLLVDQVREVNHFVAQTSQQGGYKVIVLHPAHAMNQSAANALLKNLEEPAGLTFFILATTKPGALLPTIRSRCRVMALPSPPLDVAETWLLSQGVKDALRYLNTLGNLPLRVMDWFNQGKLEEHQKLLEGLDSLAMQKVGTSSILKQWNAMEPAEVIDSALMWSESLIRRRCGRLNPDESAAFEKSDEIKLFRFRDRLCQKRALLQSTANINMSLVLEEIAYDLSALGRTSRIIE